jgi:hypothetical protein
MKDYEIMTAIICVVVIAFGLMITYGEQKTQPPPLQFECGEFENVSIREDITDKYELYEVECPDTANWVRYFCLALWIEVGDNKSIDIYDYFYPREEVECPENVKTTADIEDVIVRCYAVDEYQRDWLDEHYEHWIGSGYEYYLIEKAVNFYYYNESTCTNNLSIAYCDAPPEDCNERHDLSFNNNKCWKRVTDDTCNGWDVTNNRCAEFRYDNYECFQCIEWDAWYYDYCYNSSIEYHPEKEAKEFCERLTKKYGDCTRSELRCQGSVGECEGRYGG